MTSKMNIILAAFLFLLLSVHAHADLRGTWTAEYDKDSGKVDLRLLCGERHQFGMSFDPTSFSGLSVAQLTASGKRDVSFDLNREAGSVHLEGSFDGDDGAGHFRFRPQTNFGQTMSALGVRVPGRCRPLP